MRQAHIREALLITLALCSVPGQGALASGVSAGWIERARLMPGELLIQAKLDTGADSSSLHATAIQHSQRDGKDWVAFDVTDESGRSVRLERPLVRTVRVRSALSAGQVRPVVTLGICVGRVYRITEVNLVDRSRMTQRLLIGRRFLEHHVLVDSGRRNTQEPACEDMPPP